MYLVSSGPDLVRQHSSFLYKKPFPKIVEANTDRS